MRTSAGRSNLRADSRDVASPGSGGIVASRPSGVGSPRYITRVEKMMPVVRTIGFLCFALAAGCAGVKDAPPGVMARTGPLMVDPSLVGTSQGGTVAARPPRSVTKEDSFSVTRTLEPPLDVAGLKARLRDTHAIGAFTKLALKNQVDDLLKRFRAHYQSGQKTGVALLQQPYDMLVLKVLCVVQDSDPSLARTISGSREAIWGILADPEKFNSVSQEREKRLVFLTNAAARS